MRTRRASYAATEPAEGYSDAGLTQSKRSRTSSILAVRDQLSPPQQHRSAAKRARFSLRLHAAEAGQRRGDGEELERGSSCFDKLPDDLVLCILECLSSKAGCPKDLLSTFIVCKRFKELASSQVVRSRASEGALRVRACQWCPAACTFLSDCAQAGNLEACFMLGMIRFYCLMERSGGVEMMARAAAASHAGALHALGVIQFNGSGGGKADKNLKAGVHLCARAAVLGHVDAMRELGHCLQDGYGVPKNVFNGRRLILEANVREASPRVKHGRSSICLEGGNMMKLKKDSLHSMYKFSHPRSCCSLLSDYGCSALPATLHIAHEFLLGWFHVRPLSLGLRLCSHSNCGRPETRKHEFRRCSACGYINYCSRACQALDWKLRHKLHCASSFRRQNHAPTRFIWGSIDPLDIIDFGDP